MRKKRGTDLYWVITKGTNKKHSKEPLPLHRAIAQMRALYANVPDARGGMLPVGKGLSPADLVKVSKSTYGNAEGKIGNAQLVKETKTLKFYKEGNNIIVGVRGTKDWKDWLSNFSLANPNKELFRASPRVSSDIADLKAFQSQYPPSQYHYSGVGHSLGSAVIDELIDQGLLKEGRSYNSAVHITDLYKGVDKNKRIYEEKDPLHIIGKIAGQPQGDLEVRKSVIEGDNPLEHHTIKNPAFEGGGGTPSKPISSTPTPSSASLAHMEPALKKGDPFLTFHIIKPNGDRSFTRYNTPKDFEKSADWQWLLKSQATKEDYYKTCDYLTKCEKDWGKLNTEGGMMPFAEHKEKMRKLREENLAKQKAIERAKANISPIGQPPPPPPPIKSNRKITFEGKGIQGKFHQQIIKAGMTPEGYMRQVLKNAKANGYGEYTADIEFSDDDIHKLMIKMEVDGRSRTARFGRVGYGDYILWSHSNPALAQTKKDTFHRSHGAIKGKWQKDPLSPNNLSLHILW